MLLTLDGGVGRLLAAQLHAPKWARLSWIQYTNFMGSATTFIHFSLTAKYLTSSLHTSIILKLILVRFINFYVGYSIQINLLFYPLNHSTYSSKHSHLYNTAYSDPIIYLITIQQFNWQSINVKAMFPIQGGRNKHVDGEVQAVIIK